MRIPRSTASLMFLTRLCLLWSAPLLVGSGCSAAPAATPPSLPPILYQGGQLMTSPKIVPIFWTGDSNERAIVEFDKWLMGSSTWLQMVGEYDDMNGTHIGAGTVATPIILGAPPSDLADADMQTLIDTNTKSGAWPPIDPNTLYVFYANPGTAVPGGCSSFDGYHSSNDMDARYAIVLRCNNGWPDLSQATMVSTHEIGEAATDPQGGGYIYAPFNIPNQGENGDLCAWEPATPDGTHVVQRMFSNQENALGHDPCVPVPANNQYANVVLVPAGIHVSATSGATLYVDSFASGTVAGPVTMTIYAPGLTVTGPMTYNPGESLILTLSVAPGGGGFGFVPITVMNYAADGTMISQAYAAALVGR